MFVTSVLLSHKKNIFFHTYDLQKER